MTKGKKEFGTCKGDVTLQKYKTKGDGPAQPRDRPVQDGPALGPDFSHPPASCGESHDLFEIGTRMVQRQLDLPPGRPRGLWEMKSPKNQNPPPCTGWFRAMVWVKGSKVP